MVGKEHGYRADYHAIVVGIECYPVLGCVKGPERDALDFYAWVTSPEGGRVEPRHAEKILTSDYHAASGCPLEAFEARPNSHDLEAPCGRLHQRALDNFRIAGSRLYLYVAGHGFDSAPGGAALAAANATRQRLHNLAARYIANYFLGQGYFGEVLLFMDCCRITSLIPVMPPPYAVDSSARGQANGRRFYLFASRRGGKAYSDAGQGVFTRVLLDGLRGDAAGTNGEITTRTLANYIDTHFDDHAVSEEPADSPDAEAGFRSRDSFVITTSEKQPRSVALRLGAGAPGRRLRVFHGDSTPIYDDIPQEPRIVLSLAPGIYAARVDGGKERLFRVPREEDGDVDLE